MPAPHPPEFRQRAVELARLRDKPIQEIANDLGISEPCLRNWLGQADTDDGKREGLTSDERGELATLRKDALWVTDITQRRTQGGWGWPCPATRSTRSLTSWPSLRSGKYGKRPGTEAAR